METFSERHINIKYKNACLSLAPGFLSKPQNDCQLFENAYQMVTLVPTLKNVAPERCLIGDSGSEQWYSNLLFSK